MSAWLVDMMSWIIGYFRDNCCQRRTSSFLKHRSIPPPIFEQPEIISFHIPKQRQSYWGLQSSRTHICHTFQDQKRASSLWTSCCRLAICAFWASIVWFALSASFPRAALSGASSVWDVSSRFARPLGSGVGISTSGDSVVYEMRLTKPCYNPENPPGYV